MMFRPRYPPGERHAGARASDAVAVGFRRLFESRFVTMLRLARLLGAADPENVAQEAFVRLYQRRNELTDIGRVDGYLRATVTNLVRSEQRHGAVVRRYQQSLEPGVVATSAETTVLESISDAALLAALEGLSVRHREALVLRYWLDLSERQMADAMGCSVGSVKSHVSRGLARLRESVRGIGVAGVCDE